MLHCSVGALLTSILSDSDELIESTSRMSSWYRLVPRALPFTRLFFQPAGSGTSYQSRRFLGRRSASCDLTQLAIDTFTFASPDHGWLSTASTTVPSTTT